MIEQQKMIDRATERMMCGWMDGWMDRIMMEEQNNGWMDHVQMDRQMNRMMHGWMNRQKE